jgi:hypothetical protein
MMLEEAAVAAQTNKLSPVVFTQVTVGVDVAEASATVIRTSGMRVKVAGGTDLAALISGQDDTDWARQVPARDSRKRFGFVLGSGWFRSQSGDLCATVKQKLENRKPRKSLTNA